MRRPSRWRCNGIPSIAALENPVSMKLFDAFAAACRDARRGALEPAAARRRRSRSTAWRRAPAHPQQCAPRFLRTHRRAFDGAALGIAAPARAAVACAEVRRGALGLRQGAAVPDGIGRADHRQGSGAARADPRESGDARAAPASRRRSMPACSSSCRARSRPAIATPSRRCASSSRATAPTPRSTASARSCARATSSSRRPGPGTTTATIRAKPMVWLDGLDIPMVAMFDAGFAENGAERRAGGHDAARARRTRSTPAACCRSTGSPRGADLADLQLSLRAHARGAGRAGQGRPARCLPRLQAALRQSGERRLADRHHGHLHAAPAQGFRDTALPLAPTARCSRWSRARARRASATR